MVPWYFCKAAMVTATATAMARGLLRMTGRRRRQRLLTRLQVLSLNRALLALVRHAVRARVVLTDGVVHEVHRQLQAVADEWISDGREDDAVPNVAAARHWRRDLAPQLHALAAAVPLTGTPQRL